MINMLFDNLKGKCSSKVNSIHEKKPQTKCEMLPYKIVRYLHFITKGGDKYQQMILQQKVKGKKEYVRNEV